MNVNARRKGISVLAVAAGTENLEIVETLIQNGADVNIREEFYGWTPLIHASLKVYSAVVKVLIEAGCDINAQDDKWECTSLMHGFLDVVQVLLEKQAGIELQRMDCAFICCTSRS